eukprot:TRINITY_DN49406_c0_g1_i1.p1 TRINITY_DN49406_c0_g1~~TRINITY_DN49406_c0_g1_i1.p1  ORF type:complete len:724 (+),score=85.07 TRINITY_DN49406_c0_g1_i1:22-2172(+)
MASYIAPRFAHQQRAVPRWRHQRTIPLEVSRVGRTKILALAVLLGVPQVAGTYDNYTFIVERGSCDGQCVFCTESHVQHKWSRIRKLTKKYAFAKKNTVRMLVSDSQEVTRLADWIWEIGQTYECTMGVITLRLAPYAYTDPLAHLDTETDNVLDFLKKLNLHTGILDLLTSSWLEILSGGWPVFHMLAALRRGLRERLEVDGVWREAQLRGNACDSMTSEKDQAYLDAITQALSGDGPWPMAGDHLFELSRGITCPVGRAVALLSLAFDNARNRDTYMGPTNEPDNTINALVSTAHRTLMEFVNSFANWSPFFDIFTSDWPLLDLLAELTCMDTRQACIKRSAWRCFDLVRREDVPCPHVELPPPETFVDCGEHHVCTWPEALNVMDWCVPFDHRAPSARVPWLHRLGHTDEERVCAQCGQDGIVRTIFKQIGFRDGTGPKSSGGLSPFFVEFGARKPDMLNSAVLRRFCDWDGLLLDMQPGETPHGGCPGCPGVVDLVKQEMVTAENVVAIFETYGVPKDFDFLTIDTDYNDYWILRSLLVNGTFRPRVFAVDFNPDLPLDKALVVSYNDTAEWDGSVYSVASLLAYSLLARSHGYAFAIALEMGAHAFFIRRDLLAREDWDLPLRSVKKSSHRPDPFARPFVDVLYDVLPGKLPSFSDDGTVSTAAAKIDRRAENRRPDSELGRLAAEIKQLRSAVEALSGTVMPLPVSQTND